MAESRPLVLVFEDLHWADEGPLDFVDYLVDWADGVPLLVVGFTARMKAASSPVGAGLAHCPGGLPCRHENRIPYRRERRSVREVQGGHLFYRHPVP
jgi:hypothetical protein